MDMNERDGDSALPKPRPVAWIEAPRLANRVRVRLVLASETFQHTGSFKYRAARHVVNSVPHRRFITASSGNFGQALALACSRSERECTVVMPATSARVKVNAVRDYGGTVDLIDVSEVSRKQRVADLAAADPEAYVASAYDDPLVIEGNASLGVELGAMAGEFDLVIVPVGGGGLAAGLIQGLKESGRSCEVVGAEPLFANDAARSLRAGKIVENEREPQTIADGVRTISLGVHDWDIVRDGLSGIVEIEERYIAEGLRLLFDLANVKAEPTGALALAALLQDPERFADRKACVVVSGGNADPELYGRLLTGCSR